MLKKITLGAALVAACAASALAQTQVVVTPSNPQGWAPYTLGNGTATITTNYPRSGNGSAYINLPDAGNDYAAFYNSVATQSLSSLTKLSYDWYVASSSTTDGINPALVLDLANGNALVYEWGYNHAQNAVLPTDTWVHADILGGNFWYANFNATASTPFGCNTYDQFTTISAFDAQCMGGTGAVTGFELFMGYTVAGTFQGAADNLTYAVNNQDGTNYNFEADEVDVDSTPEPSSVALLIPGLVVLVPVIRRRKRA